MERYRVFFIESNTDDPTLFSFVHNDHFDLEGALVEYHVIVKESNVVEAAIYRDTFDYDGKMTSSEKVSDET